MLVNRSSTPKPIAPARARRNMASAPSPSPRGRSHVNELSPPPPYARMELSSHHDNGLLVAPVPVTARIAEYMSTLQEESPRGRSSTLEPDTWRKDRSQDELRGLLQRAEETIKDRESELSWTSDVCKGLYQDNMTMRDKHQALLSRIPVSPAWSPATSPRNSGVFQISNNSIASSFASMSPPTTSQDLPRPARRITVSQTELAELAEQNEELLHKVETLEQESAHSDLVGRRKLRALEKEIAGLRLELEKTREESGEIQERMRRTSLSRTREPRRRTMSDAIAAPQPVKNFAPMGMLDIATPPRPATAFRQPNVMVTPPRSSTAFRHTSATLPRRTLSSLGHLHSTSPVTEKSEEGSEKSHTPPPIMSPVPQRSFTIQTPDDFGMALPAVTHDREHEQNVVSQLLGKIQELEDTNANIASRQQETVSKLRDAQRDSESMQRLYSLFGSEVDGEVEVEVVFDDDNAEPESPTVANFVSPTRPKTLRFKTLKRNVERQAETTLRDPFIDAGLRQSTLHPTRDHAATSSHPRKTVIGLFGMDDDQGPAEPFDVALSLSSSPPADSNMSAGSLGPAFDLHSPESSLSLASNTSPADMASSLGAELGFQDGERGAVWGSSGNDHHLRNTSLFSMDSFQQIPDITTTTEFGDEISSTTSDTPPVYDVTPQDDIMPGSFSSAISLPPGSIRNRLLGSVIRDRADQWTDARFSLGLNKTPGGGSEARSITPNTSAAELRANFETIVTSVTGQSLASELEKVKELVDVDSPSQKVQELSSSAPSEGVIASPKKNRSVTGILTELYLWIQFIVIVIAFVYTVTRQGPHALNKRKDKK